MIFKLIDKKGFHKYVNLPEYQGVIYVSYLESPIHVYRDQEPYNQPIVRDIEFRYTGIKKNNIMYFYEK